MGEKRDNEEVILNKVSGIEKGERKTKQLPGSWVSGDNEIRKNKN